MINLCLVVIATQFAETKRRETERMMQERRRIQSTGSLCQLNCLNLMKVDRLILPAGSDLGGPGSSSNQGGDSVYAAMIRFLAQQSKKLKRLLVKVELHRKFRVLTRRNAAEDGRVAPALGKSPSRTDGGQTGHTRGAG